MKFQLEKASESYLVGVLLAIAGGYLDVYTYVCRGGVFANAKTGNIGLLESMWRIRTGLSCFFICIRFWLLWQES